MLSVLSCLTMSTLTAEQRQRIEENRQKALERKRAAALSALQNDAKKPKINCPADRLPILQGNRKLVTGKRFVVDVPYNEQIVSAFMTVPSAQFDQNTNKWNFHVRDYDKLSTAVNTLYRAPVFVPKISPRVRKLVLETGESTNEEVDFSYLDPICRKALMPFQMEGVKFCISKGGRALLADEMGLGKTIQALAVAYYYKEDWPLLIVCPSSVRFAWKEAFRMWFPSIPQQDVVVMTSGEESITDAEILITSYDLMTRQKYVLEKMKFGMLIFDESHSLKNPKANRTKAVQLLLKSAKRVLLLSGTPALSRPIELYSQLCIISPDTMMKYGEFGKRYCDGHMDDNNHWICTGSSNMEELNVVLQDCFMIRRLKKDVQAHLPPKRRQTIILPASSIELERKELKVAREKMVNGKNAKERHDAMFGYYSETGQVKAKAVSKYIVKMFKNVDEKLVCFAHHSVVIKAVCEKLDKNKISYILIKGSTAAEKRQELCRTFQEDPELKVAVLSITAASAGITLTAARKVVFAELFWNPGILLQAEDRVHRIGQRKTVLIEYLLARDTCDAYLWKLLKGKVQVLNKAGMNHEVLTATSSTTTLEDADKDKISEFLLNSQPEDKENQAPLG